MQINSLQVKDSVLSREGILGNGYVVGAICLVMTFQIIFTYFSPMQTLFGTSAIHLSAWMRIFVVSLSVLFMVELEKFFLHQYGKMPKVGSTKPLGV
jgi:magnesium-transporting ATPase (P-type)